MNNLAAPMAIATLALLLPNAATAEDPTIGVPNPIYAANQILAGPEAPEAYAYWLVETKMAEATAIKAATTALVLRHTENVLDLAARGLDSCTTYGLEPTVDTACQGPKDQGKSTIENAWDGDA